MYNPPSKENWYSTGYFDDTYKEYYDLGYNAKEYKEPFEPSGHERDTTYHDELNYWYYVGYYDFEGR